MSKTYSSNGTATLVLALALLASSAIGSMPTVHAQTSPTESAKPRVSAEVAAPLRRAQQAINRKDWATALAEISSAEAISNKTPYDQVIIDEMKFFVQKRSKLDAERR
jgi:hypothetical protein